MDVNASPQTVEELNDFPIKVVNGTTIYLRDVGHVRDGFAPQTNIVRQDGRRGVLVTILKAGNASTLNVVAGSPQAAARVRRRPCRRQLKIQPLADQSIFVRAAISGVVREAVIAACLTAAHDPAVPRQLAQHADHRHLDSAVDPHLDHRAELPRARPSTS